MTSTHEQRELVKKMPRWTRAVGAGEIAQALGLDNPTQIKGGRVYRLAGLQLCVTAKTQVGKTPKGQSKVRLPARLTVDCRRLLARFRPQPLFYLDAFTDGTLQRLN